MGGGGCGGKSKKESRNWGTVVMAIDPAEFCGSLEEFQLSANEMCARVKGARRLDGVTEILLPGERGDAVEAANLARGAVDVTDDLYYKLLEMMPKNGRPNMV